MFRLLAVAFQGLWRSNEFDIFDYLKGIKGMYSNLIIFFYFIRLKVLFYKICLLLIIVRCHRWYVFINDINVKLYKYILL